MNNLASVVSWFRNNERSRSFVAFLYHPRFSLSDQIFLAKRLAFFAKAGMPLIEALAMIERQTREKSKARLYESLIADIAEGQYLSTSLERKGTIFTPFAVHLIRIGETSGILTENLSYLADELTKRKELRSKIASALIYPAFITVATLGISVLLTAYIFPKILPIFISLNVALPLTTRALIACSVYLRAYGFLTLILVVLFGMLFLYLRRRYEPVRYHTDAFLLRLPLLGRIVRAYHLATAARTLGLMLRAGISLTQATDIVASTTKNRVYRRAYEQASTVLLRGGTISSGLLEYPKLFEDTFTHMIAVGEATGNLSQTFLYLAELYETEVSDLTKNLSSSIEPVLMLVMGLVVGLIAVSVITPVYSITQHLSPR